MITFTDSHEFREYVKTQKKGLPFKCPSLGRLSEDVEYKGKVSGIEYDHIETECFKKGTLMCVDRIGSYIPYACCTDSDIRVNKKGNLEIECATDGTVIELKVVGTREDDWE